MVNTFYNTKESKERAILITAVEIGKGTWTVEDRAEELKRLAEACYVQIVGSQTLRLKKLTPDFFIGKGKVQEIATLVEEVNADVVIFNNDLFKN